MIPADLKYTEEALDLIEQMQKSLLQIESDSSDDIVQQIFRDMHTLKGNSAMMGFKLVADFTHNLESVYEQIRNGSLEFSKEIINVSLEALDHLVTLIQNDHKLTDNNQILHGQLVDTISKIAEGSTAVASVPDATPVEPPEQKPVTHSIKFTPNENALRNGANLLYIIDDLCRLGVCVTRVFEDGIPLLEEFTADACYTSWQFDLTTTASAQDIRDMFRFVAHQCSLDISKAAKEKHSTGEKLPESSHQTTPSESEIGRTLAAPLPQASQQKANRISSIRVPSERLDNMMSLVSELMTLQAKLGTIAEHYPTSELIAVTESLEKISSRLSDNAFSMCLVPIENMITPFKRLVRDLSAELNKDISFVTEGTDTELDKNMMEGLADPLMHLLRNSIDHGIEAPAERVQKGKPAKGTIILRAFCAGTNVYIEIQDDGKGIDAEKVRAKAIEKGLIEKEAHLSEKEIFNLTFLPGFSTAEQLSEISGRGVGMDVVKRKIADIRGQVKISSVVNEGTTITIKLPITVSIIDGLRVKISGADYLLPLSVVDKCYEVSALRQLNSFNNLAYFENGSIPFINLSEEFDGAYCVGQEMVVVYYEEKKVGLIVDRVIGKFQAVLKPLGRYFMHMDAVSGATILGDGNIALVLDTTKVIEQYSNKKAHAIYVLKKRRRIVPDL